MRFNSLVPVVGWSGPLTDRPAVLACFPRVNQKILISSGFAWYVSIKHTSHFSTSRSSHQPGCGCQYSSSTLIPPQPKPRSGSTLMREAPLLFAYALGFAATAVILTLLRPQLNGSTQTVLHLLLLSLVLEAIKFVARGASFLFTPSDWTQVEQFVASKAIYSFFHALSLPVLLSSILLSLQSFSAHDHAQEKGDSHQHAVDALLVGLRVLLGLIRSSIFTASIFATDVELVPQTGISPELGSVDLLAITLVIFDVLLAVDISLQTWRLGRKRGRSNRLGRVWRILSRQPDTYN